MKNTEMNRELAYSLGRVDALDGSDNSRFAADPNQWATKNEAKNVMEIRKAYAAGYQAATQANPKVVAFARSLKK